MASSLLRSVLCFDFVAFPKIRHLRTNLSFCTQSQPKNEIAESAHDDGENSSLPQLKFPSLPAISPSADARTMLERYEVDAAAITKHTKKELLTAIEKGYEVVVPFRFWKLAIKKTAINYGSYDDLLPRERTIYVDHMIAVQRRKLFYKDRYTKENVHTISALLLLEKCCGKLCRHCPYKFEAVPEQLKHKKVFNGSFYV